MAIALSLLVEIFDLLQRGVNWLGGVSSAQASAPDAAGAHPVQVGGGPASRGSPQGASQGAGHAGHGSQPSRSQPQRLWGGPLRIHPTRRTARVRGGRGVMHGARW